MIRSRTEGNLGNLMKFRKIICHRKVADEIKINGKPATLSSGKNLKTKQVDSKFLAVEHISI
jgi:hypothetical protein